MLIIGIDLETTGLDAKSCEITEIGAVKWDTKLNTPVGFFHEFIKIQNPVPPEITEITGITSELLDKYGEPEQSVIMRLCNFMSASSVYVAQNYTFDKGFLDVALERHHLRWENKKWLNTVTDVPYPKKMKHRELTSLAAYHGFVNPFPHRAVTDVLTMLRVLSAYDFMEVLQISNEPKLKLWARVTYDQRDLAKRNGFYYNGERKQWYREILGRDLEKVKAECERAGFLVEVLKSES